MRGQCAHQAKPGWRKFLRFVNHNDRKCRGKPTSDHRLFQEPRRTFDRVLKAFWLKSMVDAE
jgi:hypothetical protein